MKEWWKAMGLVQRLFLLTCALCVVAGAGRAIAEVATAPFGAAITALAGTVVVAIAFLAAEHRGSLD